MNIYHRTTHAALAATITVLGLAAGIAELLVGTSHWLGNKEDPTTLGGVTIGIAIVAGLVAMLAASRNTPGSWFAGGLVTLLTAAVGLTTAGLAWIPAGIFAAFFGVRALIVAHRERSLRGLAAEFWTTGLLIVLATVYVTFGIVAGGLEAVLGIGGAAAVMAALVVRRRSRGGSAALLAGGALPFAGLALWTFVVPFTGLLILSIGLPHTLDRRRSATSRLLS